MPSHLSHLAFLIGLFDRCKFALGPGGKVVSFNAEEAQRVVKTVIEPMAFSGLRTICLSYKDYVTGEPTAENQVRVIPFGLSKLISQFQQ